MSDSSLGVRGRGRLSFLGGRGIEGEGGTSGQESRAAGADAGSGLGGGSSWHRVSSSESTDFLDPDIFRTDVLYYIWMSIKYRNNKVQKL